MQQREADIGLLIKIVNESLEKHASKELRQWELSLSQMRILGFIKYNQEKNIEVSQKDVEKYLEVSHPTVVGLVSKLEEKGLIATKIDSKDRRIKRLYLTDKEKELHQTIIASRKSAEEGLLDGFSKEEREELFRLFKKLRENIAKI